MRDVTFGLKFQVNGSLSVAVALTEWTLLSAWWKKWTKGENVWLATNELERVFKNNSVFL